MKLILPDLQGGLAPYAMTGHRIVAAQLAPGASRTVYAAAHVVVDPLKSSGPGQSVVDWEATMAFRRHLTGLGLGIAEAMDTAQRGMGLSWDGALELIRRTRAELPDALVANGCGTDHLDPQDATCLDDVRRAYLDQVQAIQSLGGRIILMASRALVRVARRPEDYIRVYEDVLTACDAPVILHWLGPMFDPALAGYWGHDTFEQALEVVLAIINGQPQRVDGIKISLLDKDKEVILRRRLPEGVKMYTGDDFNYPELIAGDEQGFSHALLGIFDPLASAASAAVCCLDQGDVSGFSEILNPTVPLAREVFRAPTQYYKTGVVFLAWLNGHQSHFTMLNGAQSARSATHFAEVFRLADRCGLLEKPELAAHRMRGLMELHGVVDA